MYILFVYLFNQPALKNKIKKWCIYYNNNIIYRRYLMLFNWWRELIILYNWIKLFPQVAAVVYASVRRSVIFYNYYSLSNIYFFFLPKYIFNAKCAINLPDDLIIVNLKQRGYNTHTHIRSYFGHDLYRTSNRSKSVKFSIFFPSSNCE